MLRKFLDKRRNVFLLAAFAVFMESLTSPCLKIGSQRYDTFSAGYFFWFGLAVVILGIYAVCWQLILERIPLTTAYLRRGFSYILLFVWSMLIFHETITPDQCLRREKTGEKRASGGRESGGLTPGAGCQPPGAGHQVPIPYCLPF